jgi:hypothetical protein
VEILSERERLQQRILALRKTIDVYCAYGDSAKADQLLDQIGSLEAQLAQSSTPGPKAHREERQ